MGEIVGESQDECVCVCVCVRMCACVCACVCVCGQGEECEGIRGRECMKIKGPVSVRASKVERVYRTRTREREKNQGTRVRGHLQSAEIKERESMKIKGKENVGIKGRQSVNIKAEQKTLHDEEVTFCEEPDHVKPENTGQQYCLHRVGWCICRWVGTIKGKMDQVFHHLAILVHPTHGSTFPMRTEIALDAGGEVAKKENHCSRGGSTSWVAVDARMGQVYPQPIQQDLCVHNNIPSKRRGAQEQPHPGRA